jgi:hypothetical protein
MKNKNRVVEQPEPAKLQGLGMALRLSLVVAAFAVTSASATPKPDPQEVARQETIARARSECYRDEYRTVYDAAFNAVRAQFSDIAKESERLGEIVTEWSAGSKQEFGGGTYGMTTIQTRSRVSVELKGRDCSTVIVRSELEQQDANGAWQSTGRDIGVEDSIYYAMYNAIIANREAAAPNLQENTVNAPGADTDSVEIGAEGGACFPNKTCNGGLTCASNICVVLNDAPGEGKEGGACYANNTCDPGLTCASKRCVRVEK